MIVHLLTGQKGTTYKTGCGVDLKSKEAMPDNVSGWSSNISCPPCATRLFVTHNMHKTIDLDDPTVAKKFHFSGKPFGFRWILDGRVVYIYEDPEGFSAMCCIPISNFVPDTLQRECTYVDAQAAAREWVIKHGDGHIRDAPKQHRKKVISSAPRKKAPPEGYTGSLCVKCGKIDEDDLVPNPENMFEEVCMVCLLKK